MNIAINTNISVKKKSGQLTNAPSEAPKVVDENTFVSKLYSSSSREHDLSLRVLLMGVFI